MNNCIEVNGLTKKYAPKGHHNFELKGICFNVPSGYITGFIGPNGAGKTTTIKLILSTLKKDTGSIKMLGSEKTLAHNEDIGIVMDNPMYLEKWTMADVSKAVSLFYKNWESKVFFKHLTNFGIDPKKKVEELSRGMKVKLQIAVALSHNAKLLILDEPTSGLDPVARDEICDLLRGFIEDANRSVLFSTHITSDLDNVADYIIFIDSGSVIFAGAKDDLLEKYVRIAGGIDDLNPELKALVIGYRPHNSGFEGMIESKNISCFPGIMKEEISLDEIIVFMNKNTASGLPQAPVKEVGVDA